MRTDNSKAFMGLCVHERDIERDREKDRVYKQSLS
uniref:Uncharacterized protein n=1 Tax=Rhizophora mucronata TaxID=61149 RepID=A0A2P2P677_RHIMU